MMSGPRIRLGGCTALLMLAISLAIATPAAGRIEIQPPALFAQAEDAAANAEIPETPSSLPHGKFLVDYVIVLVLFAAAIHAVCRSSRRV